MLPCRTYSDPWVNGGCYWIGSVVVTCSRALSSCWSSLHSCCCRRRWAICSRRKRFSSQATAFLCRHARLEKAPDVLGESDNLKPRSDNRDYGRCRTHDSLGIPRRFDGCITSDPLRFSRKFVPMNGKYQLVPTHTQVARFRFARFQACPINNFC